MAKASSVKDIYKGLRLPVWEVDKIEDIEEIGLYEEFNDIEGIDMLIMLRYIAATYDRHSPLFKVSKISKRKGIAAKDAKIPLVKSGIKPPYDEILTLSGVTGYKAGRAIIRYCRLQGDNDFVQLFTYEQVLIKHNEMLLDTRDTDDFSKLIKNINELNKSIIEIRERFLSGDTSQETKEAIINYIINEELDLSPEAIAIKDETMSWGIYGAYSKELYGRGDLRKRELAAMEKELVNDTEEARKHFEDLELDAEMIISDLTQKRAAIYGDKDNK